MPCLLLTQLLAELSSDQMLVFFTLFVNDYFNLCHLRYFHDLGNLILLVLSNIKSNSVTTIGVWTSYNYLVTYQFNHKTSFNASDMYFTLSSVKCGPTPIKNASWNSLLLTG